MKKTLATFCLLGGALALSACDTTGQGDRDLEPPYQQGRTAIYGNDTGVAPVASSPSRSTPSRVAPAERVFQRAQTK